MAAAFGLAGSLSVVVLGDESGYTMSDSQQMKMAAIEAMWETEPAPAGFNLLAWPNQKEMRNEWELKVPYVLGLIGTRTFNTQMPGIRQLVSNAVPRIESGRTAYMALQDVRKNPADEQARKTLEENAHNLGYGLLIRAKGFDPATVTPEEIAKVSHALIPHVIPLFWSFRIMVACGVWFIVLFATAFWYATKRRFAPNWVQSAALYSLPLPWVAIELGWIVAEYGRQPWAIQDVLPTGMAASATSGELVLTSLLAFVLFYTTLLIIDAKLMVKHAKQGPQEIH